MSIQATTSCVAIIIALFANRHNVCISRQQNGVLPLFWLNKPEARAVLTAYIASNILSLAIYDKTRRVDYRFIWAHLHWLPLIAYLLRESGGYDKATECVKTPSDNVQVCVTAYFVRSILYSMWIRSVVLVNTLTLLTDVKNVVDYYTATERRDNTTSINVSRSRTPSKHFEDDRSSASSGFIEQDVHKHPRNVQTEEPVFPAGRRTRGGQYVKSQ